MRTFISINIVRYMLSFYYSLLLCLALTDEHGLVLHPSIKFTDCGTTILTIKLTVSLLVLMSGYLLGAIGSRLPHFNSFNSGYMINSEPPPHTAHLLLQKPSNIFTKQLTIQESATKVS